MNNNLNKNLVFLRAIEAEKIIETIKILRPKKTKMIRIGGDADGGYLIPDDLDGIQSCFSPGVAEYAGFEINLKNNFGIESFMADYSVEQPPAGAENFNFIRKFLSSKNGDQYITLENWIDSNIDRSSCGDLMLQMDIEGAEYDVIISSSQELLKKFRIMVIEFHNMDRIITDRMDFFGAIFRKITENHHVVHLHPNNCCGIFSYKNIDIPRVLEVTLLRKDRFQNIDFAIEFPHPLDRKNVQYNQDVILPKIWYEDS